MSDINNIYKLVDEIHLKNKASGNRFVFTTTGGGFSSYSYLMGRPGASGTVLQLNGPYAQEATLKYIENPVDSFASLEAANELAITSLKQCREIMTNSKENIYDLACLKNCYGVGVSAALATKRWLKGDHRIHIVVTSDTSRFMFSVNLYKGFPPDPETPEKIFRSRTEEEELCGKLIIFIIAYICKVVTKEFFFESLYKDNFLNISDTFKFYEDILNNPIERLIKNMYFEAGTRDETVNSILCLPNHDGTFTFLINSSLKNAIILPGSFNPLHQGHISSLNNSCALNNSDGLFELCIVNVDKPPLTLAEIEKRLDQFKFPNTIPVVLTNTPLFVDKAKLFPGNSYAIGIDLVIRLINPKYTDDDEDLMIENIFGMTIKGTNFYVSSRSYGKAHIPDDFPIKMKDDDLISLKDVMPFIPSVLKKYFIENPFNEFRDLCSSELRV
jgi:hypothetical protein